MIKTGFLIGLGAVVALYLTDPERLRSLVSEHLPWDAEFLPYLDEVEEAVSAVAPPKGDADAETDTLIALSSSQTKVTVSSPTDGEEAADSARAAKPRDASLPNDLDEMPRFAWNEPSGGSDETEAVTASGRGLEQLQSITAQTARYTLWPAFTTRLSAEGLATRIREGTGLNVATEREAFDRYLVLLNCDRHCEIGTALTLIETVTGLTPLAGLQR